MFDVFTAYIKTITVMTLFSAMLEMLLPQKEHGYIAYFRPLLALLLLSVILQPAFALWERFSQQYPTLFDFFGMHILLPAFPHKVTIHKKIGKEEDYGRKETMDVFDSF